ncbi:MAG: D-2-hydroxyacid dehydrogenase [Firmicutes bacterium]|nr:D-2-hydroxyacid dehydrogenase [Bacillota bacterium]
MRIVFLDHEVIDRGDISWAKVEALGQLKIYKQNASDEEAIERLAGADAVMIDEYPISRRIMEACPDLKFIGPAATGYNHIDLDCARERGIAVCNVPAYSTEAVAQHAIALLLALTNQIGGFDSDIHEGKWNSQVGTAYTPRSIQLLDGKRMGIIGYGNIGRKTAEIARALGMKVSVYSQDPQTAIRADVVSLHCPLTADNKGMVDQAFLDKMKDGAFLINTARGGLLDEEAVARALQTGKLAGLGADVLSSEPPSPDNPLLTAPNCILTPHIAFTPVEIRQRVIDICADNLRSFLEGGDLNRIV